MSKHAPSRSHSHSHSHKQDYRTILSQRSPDHQLAVFKTIVSLVLLTVLIVYLFTKA